MHFQRCKLLITCLQLQQLRPNVIQRLALGVFVLFVVSLIIFLGVELLPGDIAQELLGQTATEETVAAIRRELGLDLPPHSRYIEWLGILTVHLVAGSAEPTQFVEVDAHVAILPQPAV